MSVIKFRICADQTVAGEKLIFSVDASGRPIAVLSHENMSWFCVSSVSAKQPVGERVTTGDIDIEVARVVGTPQGASEAEFFPAVLVPQWRNARPPLEGFTLE